MTPLIDDVWKLLTVECQKYSQENPNFKFDASKKEDFKEYFIAQYKSIKRKYMHPSVKYLDRHKVASLITISILETNVISYDNDNLDEDYIFIGAELISLKVGLAYMIAKLNEKLLSRGVDKKIEKVIFPNAQSCQTPYIEIICRNLFYAKRDFVFNPLDLADRLFLVEYITLSSQNITPDILKDY